MFRFLLTQPSFRLCLIVWLFGYILVDLAAAAQGRGPVGLMFTTNLPLLSLGVGLSLALATALRRLRYWHPALRLIAIGALAILLGAIQTAADHGWLRLLALAAFPDWQSWALSTDPSRLFTILLLYIWTFFLSAALIWSVQSNLLAEANTARASAFEAAALRAEAAALRAQLNPHFLFNALNGISGLMVTGRQEAAEDMIGRLADFLRASLASDPAGTISLDQELRTIEAYLHVEEARFGDRISVDIDVEHQARSLLVPNFILQPLVENAIKHAVSRTRDRIDLKISGQQSGGRLFLTVENSAPVALSGQASPAGTGIGIANTRARLSSLYSREAELVIGPVPGGYRATLALPAREATPDVGAGSIAPARAEARLA